MGKKCPTACGKKASVLKGRVFCRKTVDGKEVHDRKCEYWKHTKMAVPTQVLIMPP